MFPMYHEPLTPIRPSNRLRRSNTTNSPPQPEQADTSNAPTLITSSTAPLSTSTSYISPHAAPYSLALPTASHFGRSSSAHRPKDKEKEDAVKEKHNYRTHIHAHLPTHVHLHGPHIRHRSRGRDSKHGGPSSSALGLPPDDERDRERLAYDGHSGHSGLLTTEKLRGTKSKSAGGTPSGSLEGSRRESLAGEVERQSTRRAVRKATFEDVEREKRENLKREEELRSSLASLATISTSITRKLDYTYYNLLEKVSNLISTIGSFRDLSNVSSTMSSHFHTETTLLVNETTRAIDEFKSFSAQSQRIEEFEGRLGVGREKAESLARRLDAVRQRVETWEKKEEEWQKKTSIRLRILWGCAGILLLLVLGMIFGHDLKEAQPGGPVIFCSDNRVPFENRTIHLGRTAAAMQSSSARIEVPSGTCGWMGSKGVTGLPLSIKPTQDPKMQSVTDGDDPRLKVFDEL